MGASTLKKISVCVYELLHRTCELAELKQIEFEKRTLRRGLFFSQAPIILKSLPLKVGIYLKVETYIVKNIYIYIYILLILEKVSFSGFHIFQKSRVKIGRFFPSW